MVSLMEIRCFCKLLRQTPKAAALLGALLLGASLLPGYAQKLLHQQSFPIPAASALAQDVQGNLYVATQQGQIVQFDLRGNKLKSFNPDEMLNISSLQALPGLQLLAFDKNNQHLFWIDRFQTLSGSYALTNDKDAGFADAVAAAEGNSLWLINGGQMRLLKKQLPAGELLLSVPLNLVSKSANLQFTYLREHKGKLYLYSPTAGLLVFDALGNYEQTHHLPELESLWLDENRFYFLQKNVVGFLDLQTHAITRMPIIEAKATHVLAKGNQLWILEPGQAHRYTLLPATENTPVQDH